MYAIIEESGRQYKVSSGDTILVDREAGEEKTVTFDRVLLVGGGEEGARIGTPTVKGATVTADVLGSIKGPKIDIVKHKRRKGYSRKQGHRQQALKVRITAINA